LSAQSRTDKIELLEMYEERERRRKSAPLKYLQQHEKQYEASCSEAAIRALFWGNRVGKTEWGGEETANFVVADRAHDVEVIAKDKQSLGKKPLPLIRPLGKVEAWVGCPSFELQMDGTQAKLERWLPKSQIEHIDYLRGKIWKELYLKDGSHISFKSYEQGRDKWQSAGKDWIWFDEEPPKDIWEEAFVRQEAGHTLRIILTMTAIKGMTWVYNGIYLNTSNPDLFVSTAGWDDNPWLMEEQKVQMSSMLSPQALQVRREGKFVKRVGLVCAWWDRSIHLRDYSTLNKSWTWYEMLDGGFSDPAAYLLIGVDDDNNVHVVNGYRKKQIGNRKLKELRDMRVSGLTITRGWIDNDDPRLQQELATMTTSAGVADPWHLEPVVKKPNESKSWDETLAEKLAEYGQILPGTGKPRLYISNNLMEYNEQTGELENWLVQEIENLVWQERISKQGEETIPKWDDHRRFGHHFDGMRGLAYFLISYIKPVLDEDEGVTAPDWVKKSMGIR
jgi:phage terminase large subunit-like protein